MIEIDNIQRIANQIVNRYKEQLQSCNIRQDSELFKTDAVVELNGSTLVVSLVLPAHWKNVEFGRRAGKMPPIDIIRDWIKVKQIIPDARYGRIPTTDQLAYMISRKIGRDGIPAKKPLERTGLVNTYTDGTYGFAEATDDLSEMMIQSIKNEMVKQLRQQLNDEL